MTARPDPVFSAHTPGLSPSVAFQIQSVADGSEMGAALSQVRKSIAIVTAMDSAPKMTSAQVMPAFTVLSRLNGAVPIGIVIGFAQHSIGIGNQMLVQATAVPFAFTLDAEKAIFRLENMMCSTSFTFTGAGGIGTWMIM